MALKLQTKKGEHGTLYKFRVPYVDESDPFNKGEWGTWAYDAEHAIENFHDSADGDAGWKVNGEPRKVRETA